MSETFREGVAPAVSKPLNAIDRDDSLAVALASAEAAARSFRSNLSPVLAQGRCDFLCRLLQPGQILFEADQLPIAEIAVGAVSFVNDDAFDDELRPSRPIRGGQCRRLGSVFVEYLLKFRQSRFVEAHQGESADVSPAVGVVAFGEKDGPHLSPGIREITEDVIDPLFLFVGRLRGGSLTTGRDRLNRVGSNGRKSKTGPGSAPVSGLLVETGVGDIDLGCPGGAS